MSPIITGAPGQPSAIAAERGDVAPAETGIALWLRGHLAAGDIVIDVGANAGRYTAVAAETVGPAGHVYAVEPGPNLVSGLTARFAQARNVTVVAAAAGDTSGQVTLFLDRRDETRHSLAPGNVGKDGGCTTVEQISLDDAFLSLPRIAVVKIDAQGAERRILDGARRLLQTHRPVLILELWPHGLTSLGSSARDLIDTLTAEGYVLHRLSAKGVLKPARFIEAFLAESSRWGSINVAALPAGASS